MEWRCKFLKYQGEIGVLGVSVFPCANAMTVKIDHLARRMRVEIMHAHPQGIGGIKYV